MTLAYESIGEKHMMMQEKNQSQYINYMDMAGVMYNILQHVCIVSSEHSLHFNLS